LHEKIVRVARRLCGIDLEPLDEPGQKPRFVETFLHAAQQHDASGVEQEAIPRRRVEQEALFVEGQPFENRHVHPFSVDVHRLRDDVQDMIKRCGLISHEARRKS